MEKLKKTIYENIWNYKQHSITKFGCGYTVFENGEEFFFQFIEDAKNFIDTITSDSLEDLRKQLDDLYTEKVSNENEIERLQNGIADIERECEIIENRLLELEGV